MAAKKSTGSPSGKEPATKSAAKKSAASKEAVKASTTARAKTKVVKFDLATAVLGVPAAAAREAPSMPVSVAVFEASRLWAAASKSRGFEAAAGLPPARLRFTSARAHSTRSRDRPQT